MSDNDILVKCSSCYYERKGHGLSVYGECYNPKSAFCGKSIDKIEPEGCAEGELFPKKHNPLCQAPIGGPCTCNEQAKVVLPDGAEHKIGPERKEND